MNSKVYIISVLVALIAFFGGFIAKKEMFILNARTAVIVLFIAGFAMCSSGAIGTFISKAPFHPLTIIGYVLGSVALFIGIVHVFKLKVPYFSSAHNALMIIGVIIVLKFIIARLSFLIQSS